MARNKYELDMCNGSIMNKLIAFSLPLMASSVLQLLFNAVDTIVVGRFSGSVALAAVGSTTSLVHMFTNLFIGVSIGANVLVARWLAAKEDKAVSDAVHTAMAFSLISGILMIFVGLFLSRPALTVMGTPSNVIDQSVLYMKLYFLGMPFFMLYNYGAAILRAVGDTKRPLYALALAGVINVILNLILVIQFKMGVAGVAIATVVSQIVSAILVVRCLTSADASYRLDLRRMKIHPRHMMQMLRIGIPAGIQSVIISFSNALLQSSVNSFGSVAMAGYTAANNIIGIMYVCVNAVTQACMSFTSQNYGAGKPRRMDRIFIDCIILQLGITIVLGVGVYAFGHPLLGIYTTSEEVIQRGLEILPVSTLPYFIFGFMDLIPGALRGMGYSTLPTILCLIGTVGTRVVWVFILFPMFRSLTFLFVSYPASWLITISMQAVCYYIVRKKVHSKLGACEVCE